MSWNNVVPAWLVASGGVVDKYHKGKLPLEEARAKLQELGAPESVMARLGVEQTKEIEE